MFDLHKGVPQITLNFALDRIETSNKMFVKLKTFAKYTNVLLLIIKNAHSKRQTDRRAESLKIFQVLK